MTLTRVFRCLSSVALLSFFSLTAQAAIINFSAELNDETEIPTPTIPDGFNPAGWMAGEYDSETNLLFIQNLKWQGLTTPVVGAHIHNGVPTGPILVGFADFPTSQSGEYTNIFSLTDAQETAFLSGYASGSLYVNIHTDLNKAGEIRGFLHPVPEPETYALVTMGLLGTLIATRKRGRRM